MSPPQPLLHLTQLLGLDSSGLLETTHGPDETVDESPVPHWRKFVSVSDSTIRALIEETYGDHLSPGEIETLLPYVRRQFESSQKLSELDLGELDPRGMNFISDRRITP